MSRLILVSNRLPFTYVDEPEGTKFLPSSGGLVTALSSYLQGEKANPEFECIWVGWPGANVPEEQREPVRAQALAEHKACPVFLSESEVSTFYHGFCNRTLWPLFHYFPSYTEYHETEWQAYRVVNQRFFDALESWIQPGDTVWVHDYQLMLLPELLRRRFPNLDIGFFLHIPFPSFEIFRLLPKQWRKELLEGVLGADVMGFHTQDYTQYFLRSVFRTLGLDHHFGQIRIGDQIRRADTFPIGIDYAQFAETTRMPSVQAMIAEHHQRFNNQKIVFSVDRLDYTKGILHRLSGYETLLERNPEWLGKIVFVLQVVPSRIEVAQYKQMKKALDETVGQINGRFGGVDWVPIRYSYRSLGLEELVSLYAASDVALITPLRDGMNLVAKEYLACRSESDGVLILSEMTGAARDLGEALLVNPNHRGDMAETLNDALCMPTAEQVRRNKPMQERLKKFDALWWARNFLKTLLEVKHKQGQLATRYLGASWIAKLKTTYSKSRKRLLLLDYDGTLVPFAPRPELAKPDAELLELLEKLSDVPGNEVYLISGRDRVTLGEWFQNTPVHLIAEHGAWACPRGGEWHTAKPMLSEWKSHIRPLIENYVDRVPRSLLEEKDYGLAWHYRGVEPDFGEMRAKELMQELINYTANFDVQVLEGKKVIEIRNSGINKGVAALKAVANSNPDFVLAMGDDQTDEDMFQVLPRQAATIRVGWPFSHARFNLENWREARKVLSELT